MTFSPGSKQVWLPIISLVIIFGIVYAIWRITVFSPTPAVSELPTATNTQVTNSQATSTQPVKNTQPVNIPVTNTEPPSTSTYSDCGSTTACDADYEKYCAEGLESASWVAWAAERGYRTGSRKYARTDCLDAQGSNLSADCRYFQDCHNALNAGLMEKCGKYAAPGEVCAGITPAPGKAPLEDCLAEHLDELDAECLDVYTKHEANRL